MNSLETTVEYGPITLGEHWLGLIGYEHLKDVETGYYKDNGQPIFLKDFHLICGEHAEPLFVELESTPMSDPSYHESRDLARLVLESYFPDQTQQTTE